MPCEIRICCFCLDLRQGTYLAAAYSIILSFIGAMGCSLGLAFFYRTTASMAMYEENADDTDEIAKVITYVALIMALIMFLAWMLSAVVLIVGVRKGAKGLLLPWIIATAVVMGILAYYIVTDLIKADEISGTNKLVHLITGLIVLLGNVYALLCVATFQRNDLYAESRLPPSYSEEVPFKWKEAQAEAV